MNSQQIESIRELIAAYEDILNILRNRPFKQNKKMEPVDVKVMCRICGVPQADVSQCLSLSRLPPQMVMNWLQQMFVNPKPDFLEIEGFPTIICSPCTDTAKKVHKFITKCYHVNGIDFPKQDWWNSAKAKAIIRMSAP